MFISDFSENQAKISVSRELTDEQKEKLNFHLRTGDYFAFLSSALSFCEDDLGSSGNENTENKKEKLEMVRDIRKTLNYLNKNHSISPKDRPKDR